MWSLLLALAHAHELRVDVLDVGQGDSILIRHDGKVVLIDAGDPPRLVADQLRAEGITQLDLVIASHPHADHIGGMLAVVDGFPIRFYLDNRQPHTTQTYINLQAALAQKASAGLVRLAPGKDEVADDADFQIVPSLNFGDATLDLLFPLDDRRLRGTRSDLNANSVVARVTHGEDCFLFVGDAEADTEHALLGDYSDPGQLQCGVLKVAHHGSEYATTAPFLAAVDPAVALISVGADNRYGHPGPRTVQRLQDSGAAVYRTDLQGRITVRSMGKGVVVTTEKQADGSVLPEVAAVPRAETLKVAPATLARAPTRTGAEPGPSTVAAEATAAPAPLSPAADPELPPAASTQAACPFPASRSSKVFHEDGCGTGGRISPENLVCYPTREAALAAGKGPAGCCKP